MPLVLIQNPSFSSPSWSGPNSMCGGQPCPAHADEVEVGWQLTVIALDLEGRAGDARQIFLQFCGNEPLGLTGPIGQNDDGPGSPGFGNDEILRQEPESAVQAPRQVRMTRNPALTLA